MAKIEDNIIVPYVDKEIYLLPRDLTLYSQSAHIRASIADLIRDKLIRMRYSICDLVTILIKSIHASDPYKVNIRIYTTLSDIDRDEFFKSTRLLVDYKIEYCNMRGWKVDIISARLSGNKIRVIKG